MRAIQPWPRIPQGGLYSLISSPNYLGEAVEWCGYAAITQTSSSLWFALWNLVFLGSRALQTHAWYRSKFGADYPRQRRAFIPYLL